MSPPVEYEPDDQDRVIILGATLLLVLVERLEFSPVLPLLLIAFLGLMPPGILPAQGASIEGPPLVVTGKQT
jgi:hypothetical protein